MTDHGESRRRGLTAALIFYAAVAPSLAAAVYLSRSTAGVDQIGFLHALAWQTPIYVSWALTAPIMLWAGRRFALERGVSRRRGSWLAPLPAYVALSVPAVAAHALLTVWLDWRMDPSVAGSFADVRGALFAARLPIDVLLYWAIVGVVYAYEYASRLRAGEESARVLEAELARAQLHALKMQLHPHFLFNALQTITTLIPQDPGRAVKVTVLLGDLLRTTLGRASSQLVPLADEIGLLRTYLEIEQIRFGDRLTVRIDAGEDVLDLCVPDLILQPHVENAIRHGLAPRRGPVTLAVRAVRRHDTLRLEVEDDGVGVGRRSGDALTSQGIGHRVTAARLAGLFGRDHTFTVGPRPDGTGTLVEIEMPVIVGGA